MRQDHCVQTLFELEEELADARAAAETARQEMTSLKESHEQSVKMVASLQQQLEDLKVRVKSRPVMTLFQEIHPLKITDLFYI